MQVEPVCVCERGRDGEREKDKGKKKDHNWQRGVAYIYGGRLSYAERRIGGGRGSSRGVNWGLEFNAATLIHREPQQPASAESHSNPTSIGSVLPEFSAILNA